jgi:chaperone BCS1
MFNNNPISIKRTRVGQSVGTAHSATFFETLVIMADSHDTLKNLITFLIKSADASSVKPNRDYINLYVYEKSFWSKTTAQKKRSIETVYLPDELKTELLTDIIEFRNDRELYETNGVPYKRSYLLLGPPGTGKTSLIYAIASYFDLDIGIFKVSTEKQSLEQSYKELPKNTIMLIEDIENFFPTEGRDSSKFNKSDLLNVLDGVIVKDQLLTFMTANNINDIPKVLLRSGRVDKKIMFDYCTKDQIKKIYKTFRRVESDVEAEDFYNKVRHLRLTPAILQSFLFRQKKRKLSELEEIVQREVPSENYKNMFT